MADEAYDPLAELEASLEGVPEWANPANTVAAFRLLGVLLSQGGAQPLTGDDVRALVDSASADELRAAFIGTVGMLAGTTEMFGLITTGAPGSAAALGRNLLSMLQKLEASGDLEEAMANGIDILIIDEDDDDGEDGGVWFTPDP